MSLMKADTWREVVVEHLGGLYWAGQGGIGSSTDSGNRGKSGKNSQRKRGGRLKILESRCRKLSKTELKIPSASSISRGVTMASIMRSIIWHALPHSVKNHWLSPIPIFLIARFLLRIVFVVIQKGCGEWYMPWWGLVVASISDGAIQRHNELYPTQVRWGRSK